jgi:pimeloyl-ACP methyl ester carboxylesterase
MEGWARKRVLLYAHGGLVPENSAIQHAANNREATLKAEVYPLSFIWRTDAWSTIRNILRDAFSRRRDEGLLDKAKDFMLDRLDDTLEPLARVLGGKAMWDEMKENARLASSRAKGAARMTAQILAGLASSGRIDEIHLVGHSAGSIFLAPLAARLAEKNIEIASLSLWAPACTLDLFNEVYKPLIEAGKIKSFDLYTLDDATERDDHCANLYNKSLLYLVSAAFEKRARIPVVQKHGTPLLGLARDVEREIPKKFWDVNSRTWFTAPAHSETDARHHGDFDNDVATLRSTLERITRGTAVGAAPELLKLSSAAGIATARSKLDAALLVQR